MWDLPHRRILNKRSVEIRLGGKGVGVTVTQRDHDGKRVSECGLDGGTFDSYRCHDENTRSLPTSTPLAISIAWPGDTTYETDDSITWEVMDNDSVIASDVKITDGTLPTEILTNIIMKIEADALLPSTFI